MKRPKFFNILVTGLVLSVSGIVTSCAQGNYGQPGYGQQQQPYDPNYGQYGQGYGQYDQYNQGYGQSGNPDFYGQLSPYGQWVNTPEYGRVWIPQVDPNFQPYASNGHWVWTEYGNTWVSDYAWGWAPFHYGRWFRDPYRGWAWVPGNDWGPAWVSWRSGGGYYGWAPLGPGLNVNVNINIPANNWVFVPELYISSPRLYNYCVPRPQVVNIYRNTTIINNVYRVDNRVYGYGPRREEIERVTRQSVPVYRIENNNRPGRDQVRGDAVGIYRPNAGRSNGPLDANRDGRGSSRTYNEPFNNGQSNGPDGGYSRGRGNAGSYGSPNGNTPGNPVPNRGTYGDNNPRTTPADANSPYSSGSYGSSRGGRGRGSYEGQSQPAQPGQAYPQQPQQTGQAPDAGPREWGGRRGGGNYSPRENAPAIGNAPQRETSPNMGGEARGGGRQGGPQGAPDNRGGGEGPGGGYRSGRGSSRGPQ